VSELKTWQTGWKGINHNKHLLFKEEKEIMEKTSWDRMLIAEHEKIERAMEVLKKELEVLPATTFDTFAMQRAIDFLLVFGDQMHNQKEESLLFPLMIERGIPENGPIGVMLYEHESERTLLQQMFDEVLELEKLTDEARLQFKRKGLEYLSIRSNHIWKENDILFNMGRQVITEADNDYLVSGFESLNLSTYGENAERHYEQMLEEIEMGGKARRSLIHNLSYDQIDAIMETLPVEVTFVDADDMVAYFNRLDKEQIFLRTRSVIGRKVQKCHPQKSLRAVEQIVTGFKDGSLDEAVFWIDFAADKILIRYYPVRNEKGDYMGALEVTQKIGDIQQLKGEKRLLG